MNGLAGEVRRFGMKVTSVDLGVIRSNAVEKVGRTKAARLPP
jgi:hypothetical protein